MKTFQVLYCVSCIANLKELRRPITHKSKGFNIAAGFKANDGVGIMKVTGK